MTSQTRNSYPSSSASGGADSPNDNPVALDGFANYLGLNYAQQTALLWANAAAAAAVAASSSSPTNSTQKPSCASSTSSTSPTPPPPSTGDGYASIPSKSTSSNSLRTTTPNHLQQQRTPRPTSNMDNFDCTNKQTAIKYPSRSSCVTRYTREEKNAMDASNASMTGGAVNNNTAAAAAASLYSGNPLGAARMDPAAMMMMSNLLGHDGHHALAAGLQLPPGLMAPFDQSLNRRTDHRSLENPKRLDEVAKANETLMTNQLLQSLSGSQTTAYQRPPKQHTHPSSQSHQHHHQQQLHSIPNQQQQQQQQLLQQHQQQQQALALAAALSRETGVTNFPPGYLETMLAGMGRNGAMDPSLNVAAAAAAAGGGGRGDSSNTATNMAYAQAMIMTMAAAAAAACGGTKSATGATGSHPSSSPLNPNTAGGLNYDMLALRQFAGMSGAPTGGVANPTNMPGNSNQPMDSFNDVLSFLNQCLNTPKHATERPNSQSQRSMADHKYHSQSQPHSSSPSSSSSSVAASASCSAGTTAAAVASHLQRKAPRAGSTSRTRTPTSCTTPMTNATNISWGDQPVVPPTRHRGRGRPPKSASIAGSYYQPHSRQTSMNMNNSTAASSRMQDEMLLEPYQKQLSSSGSMVSGSNCGVIRRPPSTTSTGECTVEATIDEVLRHLASCDHDPSLVANRYATSALGIALNRKRRKDIPDTPPPAGSMGLPGEASNYRAEPGEVYAPIATKRNRLGPSAESGLRLPLALGWRRETLVKGIGPGGILGEVIYVTPCGRRLWNLDGIRDYLKSNNVGMLSVDDFSFKSYLRLGDYYECSRTGQSNQNYVKMSDAALDSLMSAGLTDADEAKSKSSPWTTHSDGNKGTGGDMLPGAHHPMASTLPPISHSAYPTILPPAAHSSNNNHNSSSSSGNNNNMSNKPAVTAGSNSLPFNNPSLYDMPRPDLPGMNYLPGHGMNGDALSVAAMAAAAAVAAQSNGPPAAHGGFNDLVSKASLQMPLLDPYMTASSAALTPSASSVLGQTPYGGNSVEQNGAWSLLNRMLSPSGSGTLSGSGNFTGMDPSVERECMRNFFIQLAGEQLRLDEEKRIQRKNALREERDHLLALRVKERIDLELKKPVEDLRLLNLKAFPELEVIPNNRLSDRAFADCLLVVEFLHAFTEILCIDTETIPTMSMLQSALVDREPECLQAVLHLLIELLKFAILDPGLPSSRLVTQLLGQRFSELEVNANTVTGLLRVFLIGRNGYEDDMSDLLCPPSHFSVLSGDEQVSLLAFVCDELVTSSRIISTEVDRTIELQAVLRREKWILESKIRRLRFTLARKFGTIHSVDGFCTDPIKSSTNTHDTPIDARPDISIDLPTGADEIPDDASHGSPVPHLDYTAHGIDKLRLDSKSTTGNRTTFFCGDTTVDHSADSSEKVQHNVPTQSGCSAAVNASATATASVSAAAVAGAFLSVDEEETDDQNQLETRIETLMQVVEHKQRAIEECSYRLSGHYLGQDRHHRRYYVLGHHGGVYIEAKTDKPIEASRTSEGMEDEGLGGSSLVLDPDRLVEEIMARRELGKRRRYIINPPTGHHGQGLTQPPPIQPQLQSTQQHQLENETDKTLECSLTMETVVTSDDLTQATDLEKPMELEEPHKSPQVSEPTVDEPATPDLEKIPVLSSELVNISDKNTNIPSTGMEMDIDHTSQLSDAKLHTADEASTEMNGHNNSIDTQCKPELNIEDSTTTTSRPLSNENTVAENQSVEVSPGTRGDETMTRVHPKVDDHGSDQTSNGSNKLKSGVEISEQLGEVGLEFEEQKKDPLESSLHSTMEVDSTLAANPGKTELDTSYTNMTTEDEKPTKDSDRISSDNFIKSEEKVGKIDEPNSTVSETKTVLDTGENGLNLTMDSEDGKDVGVEKTISDSNASLQPLDLSTKPVGERKATVDNGEGKLVQRQLPDPIESWQDMITSLGLDDVVLTAASLLFMTHTSIIPTSVACSETIVEPWKSITSHYKSLLVWALAEEVNSDVTEAKVYSTDQYNETANNQPLRDAVLVLKKSFMDESAPITETGSGHSSKMFQNSDAEADVVPISDAEIDELVNCELNIRGVQTPPNSLAVVKPSGSPSGSAGWYRVTSTQKLRELTRALAPRGIRERNLTKSFKRAEEVITQALQSALTADDGPMARFLRVRSRRGKGRGGAGALSTGQSGSTTSSMLPNTICPYRSSTGLYDASGEFPLVPLNESPSFNMAGDYAVPAVDSLYPLGEDSQNSIGGADNSQSDGLLTETGAIILEHRLRRRQSSSLQNSLTEANGMGIPKPVINRSESGTNNLKGSANSVSASGSRRTLAQVSSSGDAPFMEECCFLEDVEALEDRVLSASLQIKGWQAPVKVLDDETIHLIPRSTPKRSRFEHWPSDLARSRLLGLESHLERRYLLPPLNSKIHLDIVQDLDSELIHDNTMDLETGSESGAPGSESTSTSLKDGEFGATTAHHPQIRRVIGRSSSSHDQSSVCSNQTTSVSVAQTNPTVNPVISTSVPYYSTNLEDASNYLFATTSLEHLPPGLVEWRHRLHRATEVGCMRDCMAKLVEAIAWEKSIMKVLCQICRRDNNEAQLLLCDGCDHGYHTYCFRPQLIDIPPGDWFCYDCVSKATGKPVCFVCGTSVCGTVKSNQNNTTTTTATSGTSTDGTSPARVVVCEHCSRTAHPSCMRPVLARIPKRWFCANCSPGGTQSGHHNGTGNNTCHNTTIGGSNQSSGNAKVTKTPSVACNLTTGGSNSRGSSSSPSHRGAARKSDGDMTQKLSSSKSTKLLKKTSSSSVHPTSSTKSKAFRPVGFTQRLAKAHRPIGSGLACKLKQQSKHRKSFKSTTRVKDGKGNGMKTNSSRRKNQKLSTGNNGERHGSTEDLRREDITADEDVNTDHINGAKESGSSRDSNSASEYTFGREDDVPKQMLSPGEIAWCRTATSELINHEASWAFRKPVNIKQVPFYRKVIKYPMDLSTIYRKTRHPCAYSTIDEWRHDVRLIFNNCEIFNEDDSEVGRAGHTMRAYFEATCTQLAPGSMVPTALTSISVTPIETGDQSVSKSSPSETNSTISHAPEEEFQKTMPTLPLPSSDESPVKELTSLEDDSFPPKPIQPSAVESPLNEDESSPQEEQIPTTEPVWTKSSPVHSDRSDSRSSGFSGFEQNECMIGLQLDDLHSPTSTTPVEREPPVSHSLEVATPANPGSCIDASNPAAIIPTSPVGCLEMIASSRSPIS